MSDKDERYTPREIFAALKLQFDLDPCAGDNSHLTVPALKFYTKSDDGLSQPWKGMVWMNPPMTGRNAQVPWLEKFIEHGNGVGIAWAYTSSKWFQDLIPEMDGVLFPRGKTEYLLPDGSGAGCPPMGSVLFSMGKLPTIALMESGLGALWLCQRSEWRSDVFADRRT